MHWWMHGSFTGYTSVPQSLNRRGGILTTAHQIGLDKLSINWSAFHQQTITVTARATGSFTRYRFAVDQRRAVFTRPDRGINPSP